jgi:hypothetical protein
VFTEEEDIALSEIFDVIYEKRTEVIQSIINPILRNLKHGFPELFLITTRKESM